MRLILIILSGFALLTNSLWKETSIFAAGEKYSAKCAVLPFAVEYKNAKVVFAGKILSERTEGDQKIFTFQVDKYWKGKVNKTVEVRYYENVRYQAWLKVGERYLVYAKASENGVLTDGRCSWTKNYSIAKNDLKLLKKARVPR